MNKLMAVALLIGGWLAIGCQSNNNTAEPQTDAPVALKINQSSRLGQDVTVQVTSIQDSRCPSNGLCVWAGNAKVEFTLEKGADRQAGSLCLGACGHGIKNKDTTTVQLGGGSYRVVLNEVRPYPGDAPSDTKPEAIIQLLR